MTLTAEDIYENGDFILELKSGGECIIHVEGGTETCSWALDGETFTLTEDEETFEGTLKDGVIVLNMMGMEVTLEKQ